MGAQRLLPPPVADMTPRRLATDRHEDRLT